MITHFGDTSSTGRKARLSSERNRTLLWIHLSCNLFQELTR